MTWSPNVTFAALLDHRQRDEVYAIEISGHGTVFTTGPVTSPTWTYVQTLGDIEIEPGSIDVAKGRWKLGALRFALGNGGGTARAVAALADLAGRTVTLWMGFLGLAQANWEKIGTYTIEGARIEEYGRYVFRCIEPFPELTRTIASSLGAGQRKTLTRTARATSTRIYVESIDGIAAGQDVAIGDERQVAVRTVDSVGSDTVADPVVYWVDLTTMLGFETAEFGSLAPCRAIRGNVVNMIVRMLVDDFATVGSIQTDFPLDEARGPWQTHDGYGVPLARLDVADIKAQRDAYIANLGGTIVMTEAEDDGRGWLDRACHGVLQLVSRRNGLLTVRSTLIPFTGSSPLTISREVADGWSWDRAFVAAHNRILVDGDEWAGQTQQLAVVEDAASVAQIGPRELRVSSPWIRKEQNGEAIAAAIGGRLLARTVAGVETIECRPGIGAATLEAGDLVLITHDELPDTSAAGAMDGALAEVSEAAIDQPANALALTMRRYPNARGGLIAPNTQVDYGSASALEKAKYAFISDDNGLLPDGKSGNTWV
jgi:hypothetical protein